MKIDKDGLIKARLLIKNASHSIKIENDKGLEINFKKYLIKYIESTEHLSQYINYLHDIIERETGVNFDN